MTLRRLSKTVGLVDPEGLDDWLLELDLDLAASRALGEPVLKLLLLGSLVRAETGTDVPWCLNPSTRGP